MLVYKIFVISFVTLIMMPVVKSFARREFCIPTKIIEREKAKFSCSQKEGFFQEGFCFLFFLLVYYKLLHSSLFSDFSFSNFWPVHLMKASLKNSRFKIVSSLLASSVEVSLCASNFNQYMCVQFLFFLHACIPKDAFEKNQTARIPPLISLCHWCCCIAFVWWYHCFSVVKSSRLLYLFFWKSLHCEIISSSWKKKLD